MYPFTPNFAPFYPWGKGNREFREIVSITTTRAIRCKSEPLLLHEERLRVCDRGYGLIRSLFSISGRDPQDLTVSNHRTRNTVQSGDLRPPAAPAKQILGDLPERITSLDNIGCIALSIIALRLVLRRGIRAQSRERLLAELPVRFDSSRRLKRDHALLRLAAEDAIGSPAVKAQRIQTVLQFFHILTPHVRGSVLESAFA